MRDYGRKLTENEYTDALAALQGGRPPQTEYEQKRHDEAAFNLLISHKLGVEFPWNRRMDLWFAHRGMVGDPVHWLFSKLFRRWYTREHYGKALTAEELKEFLS